MNQLGIVSPNPIKPPTIGVMYNNDSKPVTFRASSSQTQQDRFDAILKEEEKRQKSAKREKRFSQFMQFGIFAAIVGGTIASIWYLKHPENQAKALEQTTEELDKMWQDLSKEATIEDLALPKTLQDFTKKIKRCFSKADIIKKRGGEPIKSVLLYGPPGTGKTSYAYAIAKEFPNSKLATLDMTVLDSGIKSVGDKNLKNATDRICQIADELAAKDPNGKVFVLIDEMDTIAMVDNSLGAADSNKTLNVFKRELNNMMKRDNILIIGTTNLDVNAIEEGISIGGKKFDKALRDRFNEKGLIDYITPEQAINKVVRGYLDKELVSDSLKNTSDTNLQTLFKFFAKKDSKHSFRDLKNVINDAAMSFEHDTDKVELIDLVRAIKNKQVDYHFTDEEFAKLLQDLKIDPSKI